jgi:hypothetical protein
VARKVVLIFILSVVLACFLFLKPVFYQKSIEARLIDRLPSADFIGKLNILELARETSGMMYYHKLPFRDLTSKEFLLSQGKSYGLNLQKPIYIFGDEVGDGGCLIHVSDSTKIASGIDRLRKSVNIKDTLIEKQKVFFSKKDNVFLHYGSNYLLLYKGTLFSKTLKSVLKAKHKKILPLWSRFLKEKHFKNEHLVIFSNWSKLKKAGIESAIFAHDSDSLSFNLKSYLRKTKPFYIKKKEIGLAFSSVPDANKSVELHLDISELKQNLNDPLLLLAMNLGKRIGFPFIDFIKAWEGDLCFVEGGTQKTRESYIETELDENFNTTEVQKYRDVLVPGYSLYLSTNKLGNKLINRLFEKGIMTSEAEKIRFLYSPLLKIRQANGYIQLYSGNQAPRLVNSSNNSIVWTNKGTIYRFNIDSLNRHEIFGSLQIPVKRIFRRNKLI